MLLDFLWEFSRTASVDCELVASFESGLTKLEACGT